MNASQKSTGQMVACGLLIYSFNGKPQASWPYFAYAYGSPLNENAQYTTKSTPRKRGTSRLVSAERDGYCTDLKTTRSDHIN